MLVALSRLRVRSYVPEPRRARRRWKGTGKAEEQRQVYANRQRVRGPRNKRLQAKRAELNERSHAHLYETGGMRRVHLRGRENILKRLLIQGAGFNLALIMRARYGLGTPRGWQGRSWRSLVLDHLLPASLRALWIAIRRFIPTFPSKWRWSLRVFDQPLPA